MKRYYRELAVTGVLLTLLVFLALAAPEFYSTKPLLSFLAREGPTVVVAAGMALVFLARQIDISAGSQFALCGVGAGLLAAAHWPPALVLPVAIALGALLGLLNGVLVALVRLPSIVVTLATMVFWREALRWQRQGEFINLPDGWQWFGMSQAQGQWTIIAGSLAILACLAVACRHLAGGRHIYAVGSDAEAARLAGVNPRRVTLAVFVFLGALCGLAAFMNSVQSPQVDPKSGTGLELKAIAAVVVGGVAMAGGRGNLWGVLAGALLLACVGPALTYLHVEAYWERAIQGLVILLAVMAEGFRRKTRAGA